MKKSTYIITGAFLLLAIGVFAFVSLAPHPRPLLAWIDSGWNLKDEGRGRFDEHRPPRHERDDRGRGPRWGRFHRGGPPPGRGPHGPRNGQIDGPEPGWAPIEELISSEETMEKLHEHFPKLAQEIEAAAEARGRMVELLAEYQNTDDSEEKKKLEQELRPMLEREINIELRRQQIEIEFLEMKLRKLKEILHKREQAKQRFLDRHIRQVLENPPDFIMGPAEDEVDSASE